MPSITPDVNPQPVVPTGEPLKSKSSMQWIWQVMGGLVLISIGVAGGLVAGKSLNISQPVPTPTPEVTIFPTSTLDPTAGWKTYSSPDGYRFKYPTHFRLSNYSEGQYKGISVAYTGSGQTRPESELADGVVVRTLFLPDVVKPLKNYVEDRQKVEADNCSDTPCPTVSPLEERQLGGVVAYSFIVQGRGNAKMTYIKNENSVLQIAALYDSPVEKNLSEYILLADHIIETFQFFDAVTPSPVPTEKNIKVLNYNLPSDWKTAQDKLGMFEIGYDPSISKVSEPMVDNAVSLFRTDRILGSFISVRLLRYDGGSRHEFLYAQIGEKPVKEDLLPSYHEKEYTYNGKSCLFLIGITISQYPTTWGMCDAGSGKAFLITSYDDGDYEKTVQTIRLLK